MKIEITANISTFLPELLYELSFTVPKLSEILQFLTEFTENSICYQY